MTPVNAKTKRGPTLGCWRSLVGYVIKGPMQNRVSQIAFMGLFTALLFWPGAQDVWARGSKAKTPRPRFVLVGRDVRPGRRTDLWVIGVRRKTRFRISRDASQKSALQCTPSGKRVVYVSKRKVYSLPLFKEKKKRRRRVELGRLPKSLWKAFAGQLQHFVKLGPLGKFVALPTKKGIRVVGLDTGKAHLFKGRFCKGKDGEAGEEGVLRLVHPVFWMPRRQQFLYLAIRGEDGKGGLQVGVYDAVTKRQSGCMNLGLGKSGGPRGDIDSVDRFEGVWRNDGAAVAVSLRVRFSKGSAQKSKGKKQKTAVFHRVIAFNPTKKVSPPSGLVPTRWHGWQHRSGTLLFTGRHGKQRKVYAWPKPLDKARKKILGVAKISKRMEVLHYSSFLRTALLEYPGRKGCRKSRLVKMKRGRRNSLIRWAVWSELLARDPSGQWGLFRGASRCRHRRPVMYLMRIDGSKLMRELPKRFRWLRTLPPSKVTLCPR